MNEVQIKGDQNTFTFKHELRNFGAEWNSNEKIWTIDVDKFMEMTGLDGRRRMRVKVFGFELLNTTYEYLTEKANAKKLQNEINESIAIENKKIDEMRNIAKKVSEWLSKNSRENVISAIKDTLYCSKSAINVIEERKSLSESQIKQVEIYLS